MMRTPTNLAAVAIAVALLTGCAPAKKEDPAVEAMRTEAVAQQQMLAAIATWVDAWDTGNTDGLDAITASSFKRTAPDQNANSLEELKAMIAQVHTVYPDFRISNDASAAGPDGGFVQWTATGTDTGSEGATGKPVNVTGISRYEFVDGKIASEFVAFDSALMMRQLGREMPHGTP